MKLVDFSARTISPTELKCAGYDGVVAYVSESRPGANFGAKPLTREYADALRAAGLAIVSNYQYGKPHGSAPSDFTRGYDGGVADAHTAMRLHESAGGPDNAPIFFSIDDDIDLSTWNRVGVEWLRGINSVLGVDRTGIYGHSRVCAWAIEDGVIGCSTTPGRRWAWQTKAWSCGEREPMAVLYQGVVDTASNPGPLVDGVHVDVNEVLADDFGQWRSEKAARALVTAPDFLESTEIRSPYYGSRNGVAVAWFVLHTEDGYSKSARNLANYLANNPYQVSYHYTVDNAGQLCNLIDPDNYANSVFQPGNSKSINLAFAGSFANWSRQTWFDEMQHGIDVAAFVAVRDSRRYGLQPRVISPEEARRGATGITDHNGVRIATGRGDHTDVGPGFPWDYFANKMCEFAGVRTLSGPASAGRAFPCYPGTAIAEGAAGRDVALIQRRLNETADAGLLVDGEFGPLTSRAVNAFQNHCGLVADGRVGPQTWAELFSHRDHHSTQEIGRAIEKSLVGATEGEAGRERAVYRRYWPLGAGRRVTSPFGWRDGEYHTGIDFGRDGGSANMAVYACQSGTVIYAGQAQGYGGPDPAGWLVIDSADDQGSGCVEYGHIIREVARGDAVVAGQRIGRINPDSRTNGGVAPHLHLSFMPRAYNPRCKEDPEPWLRDALEPEKEESSAALAKGERSAPARKRSPKRAARRTNATATSGS